MGRLRPKSPHENVQARSGGAQARQISPFFEVPHWRIERSRALFLLIVPPLLDLFRRLFLPRVRRTYELSAFFHGHSFIEDVAHYTGTLLKHDAAGTNDTVRFAPDNSFVDLDITVNGTILPNHEMPATNVPDYLTI